jgi:hypothetical protein
MLNKWANELSKQFLKEAKLPNTYMNKCSRYLAIKEMQIKMTAEILPHLVRMTLIMNTTKTTAGCVWGWEEPSYTVGGNVN